MRAPTVSVTKSDTPALDVQAGGRNTTVASAKQLKRSGKSSELADHLLRSAAEKDDPMAFLNDLGYVYAAAEYLGRSEQFDSVLEAYKELMFPVSRGTVSEAVLIASLRLQGLDVDFGVSCDVRVGGREVEFKSSFRHSRSASDHQVNVTGGQVRGANMFAFHVMYSSSSGECRHSFFAIPGPVFAAYVDEHHAAQFAKWNKAVVPFGPKVRKRFARYEYISLDELTKALS